MQRFLLLRLFSLWEIEERRWCRKERLCLSFSLLSLWQAGGNAAPSGESCHFGGEKNEQRWRRRCLGHVFLRETENVTTVNGIRSFLFL